MNMALSLAVEKPTTRQGQHAVGSLIESFDNLLARYKVEPVTWTTTEEGEKLVFRAYIPADCLPEFDQAADHIAECFNELSEHQEFE